MNEIVSSIIAFAIGGIAYVALMVILKNKRKRRTTAEIIEDMWAKMNKQEQGEEDMKAPDKIYLGIQDLGSGYTYDLSLDNNGEQEYIRKDALIEWINAQQEKLWELLPDADNDNPTQMELRYLGQYMQLEALEDKLNSF